MTNNPNKMGNFTSSQLNPEKIDRLISWLRLEKTHLENEKRTHLFVEPINILPKITKGRIFYYVDLRVAKKSRDYLERKYNPFVIRENRSFRLNFALGTCIKCESATDFRMVFDNDPKLVLQEEYKLENTPPIQVIERQIDFMNDLKINDSLLRRIIFGEYIPKPPLKLTLAINPILNQSQKEAVRNAVQAQDFHLILGPPGTGKTTIICEMCRHFTERGEKVLLTSWMNVAVDTALKAVLKERMIHEDQICRIGAGDYKISEDILPISFSGNSSQMMLRLTKAKIVGSTLASTHKTEICGTPPFDVVIVDEAGTSTVSQTLFALGLAKKFILIGDHLQLPPIIAVKGVDDWIRESLFEKLWKIYPSQHNMLNEQYRMAPEIAKIASDKIYSKLGGIQTHELVRNRSTPFDKIKMDDFAEKMQLKIVDPKRPVCWVAITGEIKWIENGPTKSANNIDEIESIDKILDILINKAHIDPSSIGVLSPFRYQVSTMINTFEKFIENGLVINTIHSFQGGEKDLIIISLVTDSPDKSKIYEDIRLLNVAITRSKFKLIIVGNSNMVTKKSDISIMLNMVRDTAISNGGYFVRKDLKPEVNREIREMSEKDIMFAREIDEIQKLKRETFGRKW